MEMEMVISPVERASGAWWDGMAPGSERAGRYKSTPPETEWNSNTAAI